MARIIRSLFGFNREDATPEEMEAYRVANEALQYRVNMIARQPSRGRSSSVPTTDAFGHPI